MKAEAIGFSNTIPKTRIEIRVT